MGRLGLALWLLAGGAVVAGEHGGLPEGPGRELVFATCDACHSIRLVTQQGLSRDAWAETLDYMVDEQGLPEPSAAERALMLDYLAKNFGIDAR